MNNKAIKNNQSYLNTDKLVLIKKHFTEYVKGIKSTRQSKDIVFFNTKDIINILNISTGQTQRLFLRNDFPSCNYFKSQVIEKSSLINFLNDHKNENSRFSEALKNEFTERSNTMTNTTINILDLPQSELERQINLLNQVINLMNEYNELLSSTLNIEFLSIKDVAKILGCSEKLAQKLFNDPEFPCENYGSEKKIMATEFVKYFSVRRDKNKSLYWRNAA